MTCLILVLLLAFNAAYCDEIYQNSSHICEQCTCINVPETEEFTLDCNHQHFGHVLANWPEYNGTLVGIFSYNNLTTLEVLPASENPARLIFDHCNIKYVDPHAFANIKVVEWIDLSYNLLTTEEIDGQDFKGPYNTTVLHPLGVKYLNLAFNQIHSLPRKFFESMLDLEELNLAGNNLQVLDYNTQQALTSLDKLKVLNISHNKLIDLVEYAVLGLRNLREIDLSWNHIDFVPETLVKMQNLKNVKLDGNFIHHLDDKSFLGLNLVEVHLSYLDQLKFVSPNAFTPMPQLKKVVMCNNVNLHNIDREAFSPKHALQELYLNNNSLYELEYQMLNWSTLRIFEIMDNPLICDCRLLNISQHLSADITNNLDGPHCMDASAHVSRRIYNLPEQICDTATSAFSLEQAGQHFETVRVIVITLCTILTLTTFIAMVIAILRYRRGSRSYPFTAQVAYNRISRQFTA